MPNRKKGDTTRKLIKFAGYSVAVTIPRALVRELGWQDGQKVVVEKKDRHIVIRDWKK